MSEDTTNPPAAGLGPDVAARVLRASDRNTVTKVAAGEPLAPADRARLETSVLTAPTAEELSQLKANRQASLIRKWGAGGKLSREEMAEIHTLLPPAILAAPPVIDGGANPSSRIKYAHDYATYAAQIGVSERTIKRWSAKGKAVGELFPFDALSLALEWWTRHMCNTAPAELVNAVAAAKRAAAAATESTPASGPAAKSARATKPGPASAAGTAPGQEAGKPLMDDADMVAGTLEGNLQRLQVIHSANLTLLERAFAGSNEADIINRQRNAQRSGEMLNAAQRAFDEYQRARGDVVVIAEVSRDLLRIHSAMAQSLVSLIEDLGIPHARAVAAADGWFRMLQQSDFFAGTIPDLSAAAPAA